MRCSFPRCAPSSVCRWLPVEQITRAPMPERLDFVPTVFTSSQLFFSELSQRSNCRHIVDAVHYHVDIAVVIEIAERAASARHLFARNPRAEASIDASWNLPLPRLRYRILRSWYPASASVSPTSG